VKENVTGRFGHNIMTNPFEDDNGGYLVLANEEGQYSLWPSFRDVPRGWTTVGPRGNRKECLDWIERNWVDMRPKTLIEMTNTNTRKR
jgi:MbtH protein